MDYGDYGPIPLVEELVDELVSFMIFSKIDLKTGYPQIRVQLKQLPKLIMCILNSWFKPHI